ncbi:hypothetical protein GCM10023197_37360 [Gordonia humi]
MVDESLWAAAILNVRPTGFGDRGEVEREGSGQHGEFTGGQFLRSVILVERLRPTTRWEALPTGADGVAGDEVLVARCHDI